MENCISDGHNELRSRIESSELFRVAAGLPLRQPGHPEAAAARSVSVPPAADAAAASGTRIRIQQARVGHCVDGVTVRESEWKASKNVFSRLR